MQNKFIEKIALDTNNTRAKLLSRSLLWMGLGLAIIILVAYLCTSLKSFENVMQRIVIGNNWFILLVLNFLLIIGLFYTIRNPKIHISISVVLYSIFALYEGFFVSSLLFLTNSNNLNNLFLIILIPAGIFILMGLLSFLNIFDFTKIIPFMFFMSITVLIMSLVLTFVGNIYTYRWYLLLASVLFIGWIGVDLQIMKNSMDYITYNNTEINNKEINRISFIFGFRLFLDFVNLLVLLMRLIGISRN